MANMDFTEFRDITERRFLRLLEMSNGTLYRMDINKDELYEEYLDAFPEGTNVKFRENREYECSACASFIKNIGNVVAIVNNKIETLWDLDLDDNKYAVVAGYLHNRVLSAQVENIFLHDVRVVFKPFTHEVLESGDIRSWDHFSVDVPAALQPDNRSELLGRAKTQKQTLERAVTELTTEAVDRVIDLCSIVYRGTEFVGAVTNLRRTQIAYNAAENKDLYLWENYKSPVSGIRNSAIGTLLIDLSEGVDEEIAVKKFYEVVAPGNYKVPKTLATPAQMKKSLEFLEEKGYEPSIYRRYAVIEDVSVHDVLWADRDSSKLMKGTLGEMLMEDVVPKNIKIKDSDLTEMSMDKFVSEVLPTTKKLEVLFENKHKNNLVAITAPKLEDAPILFKWDNAFSRTYNGGVADSMKQHVKAAGGNVDGILRFSIKWNDEYPCKDDLDAHCHGPNGEHIWFSNMHGRYSQNHRIQILDVDVIDPEGVAVENIIFTSDTYMQDGDYNFSIDNYTRRSGRGWSAEIEFEGQIFEYASDDFVRVGARQDIATVRLTHGKFEIVKTIPNNTSTVKIWNINTQKFHRVTSVMYSPNYWGEGEHIGNKHTIFTVDNCASDTSIKGFHNEDLKEEFQEFRKVFNMISNKIKCEPTEHALCGLGYSSTVQNSVTVKADNRPYKLHIKTGE